MLILANFLLGGMAALWSPRAAFASPGRPLVVCDDVADPLTLDPQKEFGEKNHNIIQQIFEGLVRFGPHGDIVPDLAESWKRIDDTTVQFKLRRGVLFQDGERFDARSVAFTINRYLDPAVQFPSRGFIASLGRVDIVDDYTVDLVTKYPDGLLMNRLAGLIVMVPPKYYSQTPPDVLKDHPIGSGPFRFVSWKRGDSITLTANERYWEPGIPKVPGLVFRFLPTDRQIQGLLDGAVDLVTDVPGTQTTRVEASGRARIVKSPVLYTISASFNLDRAPMNNVHFREALNYAIDKDALIRYDLMGNGLPVHSIVLRGHAGMEPARGLETYAYDLPKARRLLAAGGVKPGLTLRVLDIKATRSARIIAAMWRRLGIRAQIHPTTDARMIADMKRQPAWDLMIGSCPDPMYHPYFIPFIFLYSSSPFSLTHSPAVDSLFDAVVKATDPNEQRERVAALDADINRRALTLFTYQRIRTYGLSRELVFEPYLSGMPLFRETHFKRRGSNEKARLEIQDEGPRPAAGP